MRRALRGYVLGESQVADEIVNDDVHASRIDPAHYSNLPSGPDHRPIAARLPINNKIAVYQMSDVAMCQDPGHTIYLEFDMQASATEEAKAVQQVDQKFVGSTFVFFLNVGRYQRYRRRCMDDGCCPRT